MLTTAPPEFHERLRRLVDAYHPHLRQARFQLLLREHGAVSDSVQAWGEVDTPDNADEARTFDFTIWFARDAWATLTEFERDALMDHELHHCGWDTAGQPLLLVHDIEEFNGVLARYGLWWPDAQATLDALQTMPAPQGAEGTNEMPGYSGYQPPAQGQSGSRGAGQSGSRGAGQSGSRGAGQSGSRGAFDNQGVVWSDPGLQAGDDFYTVDLGDGMLIELSPAGYQALVASVLADLTAALGAGEAQQGQSGSRGA